MSLYKLSTFAQVPNKMNQRQRATILDNNDPLKMGRVRATIPGIFEEADKDKLPWIYVRSPHDHNGNPKEANISIPRIGATINVEFHGGSPYHGTYSDTYRSKNNVNNTPFENNYPNVYGTVDRTGNSHIHDMVAGTNVYSHVAKTDDESTDDVDEGDTGSTSSSGGTSFQAKEPIREKIDAGTVAKMVHSIVADGSISTTSQGSHTTDIAQDANHTVRGNYTMNSVKNMLLSALNNMTHTASGTITHSSGSDIINKAQKIFLN